MWVSVLELGAAEHPVPLLLGPRYLCLCVAASSLIKNEGTDTRALAERERFDPVTSCRPKVHVNLRCMSN